MQWMDHWILNANESKNFFDGSTGVTDRRAIVPPQMWASCLEMLLPPR